MQPRLQGFSLKTRVGREKALASAGHVHSLNIPEKLIYVQPASQTMSIFSRVWDSKAQDPFNWALFKCYKFCERAYRLYVVTHKIYQMLHSWDKLLSTSTLTELHRDCGITVRSSRKWFCPTSNNSAGLCLQDWSWLKYNCSSNCSMDSGLLYNPTKKQTNLRAGCK